ncbi:MAG: cytochrome c [Gammaproteobacteria bacterium]|nr:cytochrome c [Gammaproteobacteria bacterium]
MPVTPPSLRRARRAGAILALAALAVGAGGTATAAGSIHFSDRLRHLMQRMDTLLYERNQSELEIDRERLARARELASAATELAREVGADGAPGVPVGDPANAEFEAFVQALAAEAATLDRLAAARRYAELPAQMERLAHRCADCHLRFRDRGP